MFKGEFFHTSASGAAGFYDYQIEQSARFDSGSSSSLSSNHFSSGNTRKFTVSFWFKRSLESGSSWPLAFLTGNANNNQLAIFEGKLYHQEDGYALRSTGKYRDFSAWYHAVYAFDIDNSTVAYRLRVYINGDEVTDWEADQRSYYSGDSDFNTGTNYIGRNPQNSATHYDGYLAEFIMIEGQQLTPSSFGETKNGVWIPKDPSGLTFGSNGYHLKFNNDGVGILPSSISSAGTHAATGSNIIGLFGNVGATNAPSNYSQSGQGSLSFTVDLGSAKTVGAWLAAGHQSAGYATRTATGTVSYSDNNSDFTSVGSSTYTFANGTAPNGHTFTPSSHRYWKLSFPSASGGDGSSGYQLSAMYMQSAQSTSIADLGADSSGNDNNFTVSGMGADHQVLDSPTFGS